MTIPVNNITCNGLVSPSGVLQLRVVKPVSMEMSYKYICMHTHTYMYMYMYVCEYLYGRGPTDPVA